MIVVRLKIKRMMNVMDIIKQKVLLQINRNYLVMSILHLLMMKRMNRLSLLQMKQVKVNMN